MNSRERLQAVLDHKTADQLCVDMGAGGQTGIGVCALDKLRKAVLGEDDYLVKICEPYQMLGDMVQAIFISGTDFGTQRSLFCSLDAYRSLYKPYHVAVNKKVHELTGWKTFVHSCGAIYPLIPELIDAGYDILNPVQCSAEGMDPQNTQG